MIIFDKNILVLFERRYIRLYHVIYRSNIIVSNDFVYFINSLYKGVSKKKFLKLNKNLFIKYADCTNFNLWKCMYNNPDYFFKKKLKISTLNNLINYLISKKFLVKSNNRKTYFRERKDLFNRFKGNINEQILTESLLRKTPIHDWWVNQKFNLSKQEIRENPYKYIQETFLKKFFKKYLNNKKVLEIGCGTGYFTKKISKYAKQVLGIDYQKKYIDIASKKNRSQNINYLKINVASHNAFKQMKDFDYIFMIDFFLFFFDKKFQPDLFKNRVNIMKNLRSKLNSKGKLIIMDPHFFWLTPFFGNSERPFGIVNEYKKRFLSSIPPLEATSKLFSLSGFLISKIYEPNVDKKFKKINKLNYNFFREFPQWIVYELSKK